MVGKLISLLLLFFLPCNSNAATIENQHKFVFPSNKILEVKSLLNNSSFPFEALKFRTLEVDDIYLDSEDFRLFKNDLSMRVRRTKENNRFKYAIQLKSEMTQFNRLRMEVDYDLGTVKSSRYPGLLKSLINVYKLQSENSRNDFSNIIKHWIDLKKNSTIIIFQALRNLNIKFSDIKPVLAGHSTRHRYVITIDKNTAKSPFALLNSEKKDYEHQVWNRLKEKNHEILFEASFDKSKFVYYSQKECPNQTASIIELEIENKFKPIKLGGQLLEKYTYFLRNLNSLKSGDKSKYHQAIIKLKNKCEGKYD